MIKLDWTYPHFSGTDDVITRLNVCDFSGTVTKDKDSWLASTTDGISVFDTMGAAKLHVEKILKKTHPLKYWRERLKGLVAWQHLNKHIFDAVDSTIPRLVARAAENCTLAIIDDPLVRGLRLKGVDVAQLQSELLVVLGDMVNEVASQELTLTEAIPSVTNSITLNPHGDVVVRIRALVGIRSHPGIKATSCSTLYIHKDKSVTVEFKDYL